MRPWPWWVAWVPLLDVMCCFPKWEEMDSIAIAWRHSAGANEVWNGKSQPTQRTEGEQTTGSTLQAMLCQAIRCHRKLSSSLASASSLSDTCKRNCVSLSASLLISIPLQDSLSFKNKARWSVEELFTFLTGRKGVGLQEPASAHVGDSQNGWEGDLKLFPNVMVKPIYKYKKMSPLIFLIDAFYKIILRIMLFM